MLEKIRKERIEKVNKFRSLGIDPYPSTSGRTHMAADIEAGYTKLKEKRVTVAGRIMSWRDFGKLIFARLRDGSGDIQLVLKKAELADWWDKRKLYDVGDIVDAAGIVGKTERKELSVFVSEMVMLTKSIRPLPEKWSGIRDDETKFRQRYLDLIMDPEKKWRFQKTAEITFAIREFLNSKGFLEIKTPILQPIYGGTNARPFETYMNALGANFYLAISHELYLKRLITAGFENVYNLVGYFRNEGIDRSHNPEFTMVETMTAFKNYEYNMDLTEEMYQYVAKRVFGKTKFEVRGHTIDIAKPWPRVKMIDELKKKTGVDLNSVKTVAEARNLLKKTKFDGEMPDTVGECMVEYFEAVVSPMLIDPTFVIGHPVEVSPLSKSMPEDPRFVERFEIYIAGGEQGDNWTELNDPIELFNRFKEQVRKGRGGDDEFHPMDVEFVEMMEYGMPPTTGLGPGIERIAMLMTGTEYIDDVIFFPMMRPYPVTDQQKRIYGEENILPVNVEKQLVPNTGKKPRTR